MRFKGCCHVLYFLLYINLNVHCNLIYLLRFTDYIVLGSGYLGGTSRTSLHSTGSPASSGTGQYPLSQVPNRRESQLSAYEKQSKVFSNRIEFPHCYRLFVVFVLVDFFLLSESAKNFSRYATVVCLI